MALLAFILALSPLFATVSGQVLDREGHPLAGATVAYKYIGVVDKRLKKIPGGLREDPRMVERGGRTFTTRTNKKGAFAITGLEYGVYEVRITGPDGARVYLGKKIVGDPADQNSQN